MSGGNPAAGFYLTGDRGFFCRRGHVTPVDVSSEPDYAVLCRRIVHHVKIAKLHETRCCASVRPLDDYPEVEAAFKLGGEPAVMALVRDWQSW